MQELSFIGSGCRVQSAEDQRQVQKLRKEAGSWIESCMGGGGKCGSIGDWYPGVSTGGLDRVLMPTQVDWKDQPLYK